MFFDQVDTFNARDVGVDDRVARFYGLQNCVDKSDYRMHCFVDAAHIFYVRGVCFDDRVC